MKFSTTVYLIAALALATVIVIAGCGGAANTTSNTAANKSNTTTTAPANNTTTTAPANNTAAKTDTAPAGDSVGVPECDEYIKKYEACLTKIAAKAPQAEPALKTAFEGQRNAFKSAAATPQGKATLAATCKQAIDTAKASTSAYSCEW